MKCINQYLILIGTMLLTVVQTTVAQTTTTKTRILFLVDASLSMKNQWQGGNKWNTAVNTISQIADSLNKMPDVEIGMRVFGHMYHEPDKNCRDSKLEVAIDSNNAAKIRYKLEQIKPKGITPLVYSIEKSATDFGSKPGKNFLIVVTDGEDACEGDPCAAALALQQNNVVLKPFIIGMAIQPRSFDNIQCIGKLTNTGSSEEFKSTLTAAVMDAISKTTIQINLNDANGKPTESNVNMTFYDMESGLAKYNFYHTLNARGLPDTLTISPLFKYRVQIHTIPPVYINDVQLVRNKHVVFNVDAAQGYLNFKLQGTVSKAGTEKLKCIMHKQGCMDVVNVQRVNTTEKYLTGTYDLEVLTLPRLTVKGVKVDQSKTTDVEIPAPGILTINKTFEAYGAIFVEDKDGMSKIYDLKLKDKQETIALQPGKYRIVYRSKLARTVHTTVDKDFEIASGGAISLKL